MKKRFLITLTGPSGVGKGYLKKCLKAYFELEEPSVYTTRQKRKEDEKGERMFLAKEEFSRKLANKELIFVNEFYGNLYGFALNAFRNVKDRGVITEIHIDNVEEFRKKYPKAVMVALLTDDIGFLEYRLKERAESSEELGKRLKEARDELKKSKSMKDKFDFIYNVNYRNEDKIVNTVIKYIKRKLKC